MKIETKTPSKVVIRHSKMNGQLSRLELIYDDATTQAIATAVISLIEAGMSMDIGDMITVTASPD
jgi:hypothetical protein